MAKKQTPLKTKLLVSVGLLLGLFLAGTIVAALFTDTVEDGNTAIIQITGPIMSTDPGSFVDVTTSSRVIRQLEKARDDERIVGVILEINSPGGSAVASDEIAEAVKRLNKTTVAWIREVGASGGYWIASAADHIVANRMSITGSIGVISSYVSFEEFLDDWNVSYNRLVAGERKDIGDPFQALSRTDRQFMQQKLNKIHTFFIEEIARNRNMTRDRVEQVADGSFFLGVEAYDVHLVDELGGKQEAIAYIENKTGMDATTVLYQEKESVLEALFGAFHASPFAGTLEQPVIPMLR